MGKCDNDCDLLLYEGPAGQEGQKNCVLMKKKNGEIYMRKDEHSNVILVNPLDALKLFNIPSIVLSLPVVFAFIIFLMSS